MPVSPSQFDVEQFRHERRRLGLVREVSRPTLVLGSTQPTKVVDPAAMWERGVELVRRRGGGGAVYLEPGGQLWLDTWIPHDDPLWDVDVSTAAEWVGAWWIAALGAERQHDLAFHRGRSVTGTLGGLVCFAGRGPGEVFEGARKVVGISQWRARQGTLFSSCAYLHWDPAPLLALLDVEGVTRSAFRDELQSLAAGVTDIAVPVANLAAIRLRLLESLPDFDA